MINLLCPVCKNILRKDENRVLCDKGHSFDISKDGYCNLLLSNKKNSQEPGDNKSMVSARETFLNKGYYLPLLENIITLTNKHKNHASNILDAGCGTGYYSIQIAKNRNLKDNLLAIDISKFAVAKAAKKDKNATFLVASCFDLPISNNCVDILLNIFSPKASEEFKRVLKDDGILIEVMAGEAHMKELKDVMYDNTRLNVVEYKYDGFKKIDEKHVKYTIMLDNHDDIHAHVAMTPYYYKTPVESLKKLDNIDKIEVTIDFYIVVWTKE